MPHLRPMPRRLLARRLSQWGALALPLAAAGCLFVAAGAGVGGGVYYTKRGAEAVVTARFDRVVAATQQALAQHGVRVEKSERKHDREEGKREAKFEGRNRDRETEVEVKLKQRKDGTVRIQVVAERSVVKWDREFAHRLLERIVTLSA